MVAKYLTAIVFVLHLSGPLWAQTPKTAEAVATEIAPLVGESTVLVGHLDLQRLDLDSVAKLLIDYQTTEARRWGYDEPSITRIMDEAKIVIDEYRPLVQGVLDTITEELGIRDIYLLGNYSEVPFLLATPIHGKTAAQKEKLATYLRMVPDFEFELIEHAGLLVAVPPLQKDDTEEFLKNLEPAEMSQLAEALADRENDLLKFGLILPPPLFEELSEDAQNDMPKEFLNTLNFFGKKTRWIAFGLDLGKPSGKLSFQLTIKTPRDRDARQLRNMLEGLIETAGTLMSGSAGMMEDDPEIAMFIDYIPLTVELAKGFLRMVLPEQDGDRLVLRVDSETKMNVVAVSGVGIALLLPAVQAAREAARRMQCVNNMSQIFLAIVNYDAAKGKFPPAFSVDENGKPLHSWRVLILPYIEQSELYSKIRLNEPWDSEYNKQFHDIDIPRYRCPSKPVGMKGQCDYSVVVGPETVFDGKPHSSERIKDGTSNTICLVERRKSVCWMDPTQEITFEDACKGIASPRKKSDAVIGSNHPGGANFGFWDGSVRFLSETIDLDTLEALLGCDDGITVDVP